MKTDEIISRWNSIKPMTDENSDKWDERSIEMDKMPNAEFGDDDFLDLISNTSDLDSNMSVLDIGCGTGRYSIPISDKVGNVVGLDFSPNMIEAAKRKTSMLKKKNVSFYIDDWHKKRNDNVLEKKFDLVFAHMTPAINSVESLIKMIDVSNDMCYMTTHFKNNGRINAKIREILNEKSPDFFEKLTLTMNLLWNLGYKPKLTYHHRTMNNKLKTAEALERYSKGSFDLRPLNEEEKEQLHIYLKSIEKDGYIEENREFDSVTIYWSVRKN